MRSINHLTTLALEGAADRHWYDTARATINSLASQHDVPAAKVADIAAILSPRIPVSRNVKLLEVWLREYEKPLMADDCMGARKHWTEKFVGERGLTSAHASALRHYLTTGRIRGPKTSQFAAALAGNDNACPLDIWMARALEVPQTSLSRRGPRALAVSRITQVAHSLSWPIASTQAALWAAAYRRHFASPILPSFTLTE